MAQCSELLNHFQGPGERGCFVNALHFAFPVLHFLPTISLLPSWTLHLHGFPLGFFHPGIPAGHPPTPSLWALSPSPLQTSGLGTPCPCSTSGWSKRHPPTQAVTENWVFKRTISCEKCCFLWKISLFHHQTQVSGPNRDIFQFHYAMTVPQGGCCSFASCLPPPFRVSQSHFILHDMSPAPHREGRLKCILGTRVDQKVGLQRRREAQGLANVVAIYGYILFPQTDACF